MNLCCATWATSSKKNSSANAHAQKRLKLLVNIKKHLCKTTNGIGVDVIVDQITWPYSVKRSDVTGNLFEWLHSENNVMSPYTILHCIWLLGENIAGQVYSFREDLAACFLDTSSDLDGLIDQYTSSITDIITNHAHH